jgi:hypothetical protein
VAQLIGLNGNDCLPIMDPCGYNSPIDHQKNKETPFFLRKLVDDVAKFFLSLGYRVGWDFRDSNRWYEIGDEDGLIVQIDYGVQLSHLIEDMSRWANRKSSTSASTYWVRGPKNKRWWKLMRTVRDSENEAKKQKKSVAKTVHSVLFYDEKLGSGAAGDCTHIYRSTSKQCAEQFAKGKECYGQPATVRTETDVPARLFGRWMREGKISNS